jgi:hypothetical protein
MCIRDTTRSGQGTTIEVIVPDRAIAAAGAAAASADSAAGPPESPSATSAE